MKSQVKFWQHWAGEMVAATKAPDHLYVEIPSQLYYQIKHPDMVVYDIETYPNVFTFTALHPANPEMFHVFEISTERNDGVRLFGYLSQLREKDCRMVGFNNLHFDYPIIHLLFQQSGHVSSYELYNKAYDIIHSNDQFGHLIYENQRYIKQIDLYKIHHFDNVARATSLKMLEFNMGSDNIKDLPYPPGTKLTDEEINHLILYNKHDVEETLKFLHNTIPAIELRDELSVKYDRDFTNHNDTKIGKDYFVMKLQAEGIATSERDSRNKRVPRQTPRSSIPLVETILPSIFFDSPQFNRVLNWLKSQTITETKNLFKGLNCTIGGFKYVFGLGGIHGSIESQIVRSDDTHLVIDLDVASYYPNLSIVNGFYPEHLGIQFCSIYEDVYHQRRQYAKGTPENAMLKLALNGVYGDSNNQYSPFYDPKYTMCITINGQLLLCMLAEWLTTISGLSMVQINTDGLTVRCPRNQVDQLTFICQTWEQFTRLELERADYSRMMIRDVNNYIAEYDNGKLKRKSAYAYGDDLDWNQNFSSQIVAIAAEQALVHDIPVEETVLSCTDMQLFMKRTKVPRSSRLILENNGVEKQLQNITRYVVTNTGGTLIKVMPPTPSQLDKNPGAPDRQIRIDAGCLVTPCNDLGLVRRFDINYDYYIEQANKLVQPLRGN